MIRHLLPPSKSDEDLFQESTMTFGEHLMELRRCLFRAIFGLAVGMVIGLMFGNRVVTLIQRPLEKALTKHYVGLSQRDVSTRIKQLQEQGAEVPFSAEAAGRFVVDKQVLAEEFLLSPRELVTQFDGSLNYLKSRWMDERRTIEQALAALRTSGQSGNFSPDSRKLLLEAVNISTWRSGVSAVIARDQLDTVRQKLEQGAALSQDEIRDLEHLLDLSQKQVVEGAEIVHGVSQSLAGLTSVVQQEPGAFNEKELMHVFLWRPAKEDPRIRAKSLSAHEAFAIYMKASFLLGVIISCPWVFYQIWSFVAAGLYRHERRFVYIFLPFSLFLFMAGASLAFLYVFEPVLTFLFQFNDWMGIQLEPRISEWLSFVLLLPIGFGVGFQLPLVMLFLERIGVFTVQDYWSQWRLAMVVIFVVAAILTPSPDPSSQLLMGVPLCLLYFGGMALCKFFPRTWIEPTTRSQSA